MKFGRVHHIGFYRQLFQMLCNLISLRSSDPEFSTEILDLAMVSVSMMLSTMCNNYRCLLNE
ncbi:hypothetical protein ECH_0102 [Ehrlichia chaffeensis str. Arkansas]|uniref:Uncharacterized protein n=1 Tax=Ehrlichia chaffeensis (strain ATCC CRL-10679 / Arkansas) TaxID=205920 RepID=Q2GI03_EHRCR|nr:DUF3514 domain-containing protein [Ehrlichia chaffeensis]ABD44958.1 hypothetical protein ECH_0102 [Ehrlichia chaffeensis str. Arkansas]